MKRRLDKHRHLLSYDKTVFWVRWMSQASPKQYIWMASLIRSDHTTPFNLIYGRHGWGLYARKPIAAREWIFDDLAIAVSHPCRDSPARILVELNGTLMGELHDSGAFEPAEEGRFNTNSYENHPLHIDVRAYGGRRISPSFLRT